MHHLPPPPGPRHRHAQPQQRGGDNIFYQLHPLLSAGLQLVCTRCYSRHFGPGGLGQELDISGRYRTDTVKAGPGCPVCHGAVFDAEKVQYLECDARTILLLLG